MEKYKSYYSKTGFKIPDNYFEDFEAKMMASVQEDKQNLSDLHIDSGFKVPPNYFETFEEKILRKLEEPTEKGKVVPIFSRRKWYAAAAVAAVLIGITSLFNNPVPQQTYNSSEVSALENYFDSGIIEFDYNNISSFIYEEDYVLDNVNFGVSDDAVFDYLTENTDDPLLIIE